MSRANALVRSEILRVINGTVALPIFVAATPWLTCPIKATGKTRGAFFFLADGLAFRLGLAFEPKPIKFSGLPICEINSEKKFIFEINY